MKDKLEKLLNKKVEIKGNEIKVGYWEKVDKIKDIIPNCEECYIQDEDCGFLYYYKIN